MGASLTLRFSLAGASGVVDEPHPRRLLRVTFTFTAKASAALASRFALVALHLSPLAGVAAFGSPRIDHGGGYELL